jgi:hypothetical protein
MCRLQSHSDGQVRVPSAKVQRSLERRGSRIKKRGLRRAGNTPALEDGQGQGNHPPQFTIEDPAGHALSIKHVLGQFEAKWSVVDVSHCLEYACEIILILMAGKALAIDFIFQYSRMNDVYRNCSSLHLRIPEGL